MTLTPDPVPLPHPQPYPPPTTPPHPACAGGGLGAEAALRLTELVRTGLELVKLVLQTSGADAAMLLTAGLPSVGADGVSPADSLAQWRMVAARVGLAAEQHALLADWRRRFLQKLDDCYGRRLLHKAQLAQLPGASGAAPPPGQPSQWVEVLLLQAAEGVGYSACAMAGTQLEGVLTALRENLREERATAGAMMGELLDSILTKVGWAGRRRGGFQGALLPGWDTLTCRPSTYIVNFQGMSCRQPGGQPLASVSTAARCMTPPSWLILCTRLQVQAARFLLAGHPFCWNGLSFALAAASLAPAGDTVVKQEPPLSQLLARLQQATGP